MSVRMSEAGALGLGFLREVDGDGAVRLFSLVSLCSLDRMSV